MRIDEPTIWPLIPHHTLDAAPMCDSHDGEAILEHADRVLHGAQLFGVIRLVNF